MKKLLYIMLCLSLFSCVDEEEYSDNSSGNFEALWKIMDEHYCFFDYKAKEYGLDWNEVHERYRRQVDADMGEAQLFEVLTNMLSELRDGHVNIFTTFNTGREWSWKEDYPSNFSDSLQRVYLGTDYRMASGLKYRILDDNIGYVYVGSFSGAMSGSSLDDMISYLAPCNGLIIDVRNNGGGQITSAEELAARFTNEELLVGYMQHKTGKGHSDFSKMEEQKLKPSKGIRWQKRVVVLTNRSVYSAANEFVKYMRCCPNVTVVGDKTGGGAGMPFSSELPNGWSIRFSACPMYDRNRQPTEFGIEPDIYVNMESSDFPKGLDTIIETARATLK
ncbi:MAG: S41 family peptidase [Prevotella sp.]|jgi:C-terminal processing protease CtpA/Prc|nr:S41 family peptidase [Prevotella sp.]